MTVDCQRAKKSRRVSLPTLDKAVIYLEQHVVSEMFKIAAGTRKQGAPQGDFWSELNASVNRLLLLQQAVFPNSDLHLQETTVFKDADGCARPWSTSVVMSVSRTVRLCAASLIARRANVCSSSGTGCHCANSPCIEFLPTYMRQ